MSNEYAAHLSGPCWTLCIFLLVALMIGADPAAAATAAPACTLFSLSPRVNYTNFSTAVAACMESGSILHVCDGVTVYANETIPPLSMNLAIVGEPVCWLSSGTVLCRSPILTFMNMSTAPVITVNANAYVTVSALQIVFNYTLFQVQDTALLEMDHCDLWLGGAAVIVNMATTAAGTGFSGTFMMFGDVGVSIFIQGGRVECTGCTFLNPRVSAVSVVTSAYAQYLFLRYCNWYNYPEYVSVQASPTAPATPLNIPQGWGRANHNLEGPTYQTQCVLTSNSYTPAFIGGGGSGGGGSGGGSSENEKSEGPSPWIIAIFTLTLLAVIIFSTVSIKTNQSRVVVSGHVA